MQKGTYTVDKETKDGLKLLGTVVYNGGDLKEESQRALAKFGIAVTEGRLIRSEHDDEAWVVVDNDGVQYFFELEYRR
jgi:hypothetical protein